MTLIAAVKPGMPDRNGLPGWKPYVYRGTGKDELTAHMGDPFDFEYDAIDEPPCWCGGNMSGYRKHLGRPQGDPAREPCQASRADVNLYSRRVRRPASRGVKVHLDAGGGPRCGQGTKLAAPGEEVTCQGCLNLAAGTHHLGVHANEPAPCGTPAAYRRHLRREGAPVQCEQCLAAEARRSTDKAATA